MYFIAIDDEVKSLELNDKSSDDEFDNEFDDLSYKECIGIMKSSFLRIVLLKRKFLVCQKSLKTFF